MKISYLSCDFCHESTQSNPDALMFENTDRKSFGGNQIHICEKCIIDAKTALDGEGESFYLRIREEGRSFKSVKR